MSHQKITVPGARIQDGKIVGGNDIMAKTPEGFRSMTAEEQDEWTCSMSRMELLNERIARWQSELELARLRHQNAMAEMQALKAKMAAFGQRLGIANGDPSSLRQMPDGTWVVREKKEQEPGNDGAGIPPEPK